MLNSGKQNRSRRNLSEQAEAACLFKTGGSAAQIMSKLKISRCAVINIKTNAEKILRQADSDSKSLQTKSLKNSH